MGEIRERRRARNEDQKLARRQVIINAATELFEQTAYEAVTMQEVAQKAGLAKGTLFLYFKTKEELFLAVLEELLGDWFSEINRKLAGSSAANEVIDLLCDSLRARPVMLRLLAILHPVLEQNTDFEAILGFKKFLLLNLAVTGERLEKALPGLKPGEGGRLLLRIDALVIGLYHLSFPGPVTGKVLQEPELAALNLDFFTELAETLKIYLAGLARF